jgi:hypothetical protein
MGPKNKRIRLWIDPAFQFRLLARIAGHLAFWTVAVFHLGFALSTVFRVLTDIATRDVPKSIGQHYLEYFDQQKGMLLTLFLIAPIILYDLLKFSHRIAGPLYRCRKVMDEMASGKTVPEFKPRQHDLMQDLFRSFSALIREWNSRVASSANGQPPDPNSRDLMTGERSSPAASNGGVEPQRLKV